MDKMVKIKSNKQYNDWVKQYNNWVKEYNDWAAEQVEQVNEIVQGAYEARNEMINNIIRRKK